MQTGSPVLEELVLQAPLILGGDTPVQVQVTAGQPDRDGRRPVAVYSCPPSDGDDRPGAVCHARGWLRADDGQAGETWMPGQWPPAGCEPVPVDGLYQQLAARGYDYGPLFQGLRAAWRAGTEIYAEVELPGHDGGDFGIHPALLDAMLHGTLIGQQPGSTAELPFSWSGVRLAQPGHTTARVRITPAAESGFRMDAVSSDGALLAAVDAAGHPPGRPGPAAAARGRAAPLYELGWSEVPAPAARGRARRW